MVCKNCETAKKNKWKGVSIAQQALLDKLSWVFSKWFDGIPYPARLAAVSAQWGEASICAHWPGGKKVTVWLYLHCLEQISHCCPHNTIPYNFYRILHITNNNVSRHVLAKQILSWSAYKVFIYVARLSVISATVFVSVLFMWSFLSYFYNI